VESVPGPGSTGQDEKGDAVTNTETGAFEAMLAHHRALEEHVGSRVAALTGATLLS
jgi:hypothetical protein